MADVTADVKFGTSGLRGRAVDLTDALCRSYMRAFLRHMELCRKLQKNGAVLIGLDLRESSPRLAAALLAEAAAQGYKPVLCGQLPTPALALAALAQRAPAVMVTGSHIPADRNGLKFYRPDGEIDKQDEAALARLAAEYAAELGAGAADKPCAVLPAEDGAARAAYKARAASLLPRGALRGLHIGVYQHSSVSRDILAEIAGDLGARVTLLRRAENFIALDTEALRAEDREMARRAAAEHKLDALISADGDGDRPLLADERGDFMPGDILGILTAYALGADSVATPVTSTAALELSGFFPHIYRCRVGSPYVLAAMAAAKAAGGRRIIGFEANGGVLLGSDISGEPLGAAAVLQALPTRDAALPLLSALGLAQQKQLPLSRLRALLPPCFTAADRLSDYSAAAAQRFLSELCCPQKAREMLPALGAPQRYDRTDGVRLIYASGDSLHFRASGNAPELRCYAQAQAQAQAQALLEMGLAAAAKRA